MQLISSVQSVLAGLATKGLIQFSDDNGIGTTLVFHTEKMNQHLKSLSTSTSSWGTNYIYQYWIRVQNNKLCGIFELGGWNVPDDDMKTMQKMMDILKPSDKRKEKFKYKRLYRTKWYEIDESDYTQDDIATGVLGIVDDLLMQEKTLLNKLDLLPINNG